MGILRTIAELPRAGIAAALAFVAFVALATAVVSRPAENLLRDVMATTMSPFTAPPGEIVVVTIDEETLAGFAYRSPVDREFVARLVERIAAARPRVIGIDLLFDQPTEPRKDRALASAIANARPPVVIASAWASDGLSQAQLDHLAAFAPRAGRGLAALSRDPLDGVVRGAFAGREKDGEWQPSFASALAQAGGVTPPREAQEMVYYRTANAEPFRFPSYPAQAALVAPDAWFADKFVLIGVDLPLEDRHATPFIAVNGVEAGTMPGVTVHAHALAQLISGDTILASGWTGATILTLLGGLAAVGAAWRPMPLAMKPLAILAVLAAMWAAAAYAFAAHAVLVPVVAPTALVLGGSALVAFVAWWRDQQDRRFLQRAFSHYVSPAVVEAIVSDPGSLRLGGERRTVTCVFTDLEGFTQFSEGLAPEALAQILNEYLDRVCDAFLAHGATIDKVVGDAVVGFLGAPAAQEDQATRGVLLAMAVDELSRAFRSEIAQRGLALGVTRVGVHTGPAIVGNFGGKRFFDYTAIGDTVNIAARLEGANRHLGTTTCISGAVAGRAQGVLLRPSAFLYLKGKAEGVEAFEALRMTPENRTLAEAYADAWRLLEKGSKGAKAAFARLAREYPEDRLVAFHAARLARGECGTAVRLAEK